MRKLGMGTWGCAGVLAIVAAAGCATESKKPTGEPSAAEGDATEPTEPGKPVEESPEAALAVARLRDKKMNAPTTAKLEIPADAAKAQAARLPAAARGPMQPQEARAVIGASNVERFERTDGALHAVLRKEAGAQRARIALPDTAEKSFRLSHVGSKMKIDVALRGASPDAKAEVAGGMVVYRNALDGATVLHRVTAEGTEDFIELERAPASPDVRYDMKIDANVAGLRLTSDTLEMLDAKGTPRLRVAPPYLVGADGKRHAAKLDVEGCAVDTSAKAPWDRPVTPPGKDVCTVHVSWALASANVKYPAVLDPSWTTTSSMSVPRYYLSLAALKNGRVVAVGGSFLQNDYAEVYDPTTATWSPTGAIPQRYLGAATTLDDGRVLYAGGYGPDPLMQNQGYSSQAFVLDPTGGTWSEVGRMSQGRIYVSAARLADGRVMVAGGIEQFSDGTTRTYGSLRSAEIFDPATNGWRPAAPMSDRRYYHTLSIVGGKLLVAGGYSYHYQYNYSTGQYTQQEAQGVLARAEIYDPGADAWTPAESMSEPRYVAFAASLSSNKVIVGGGWGNGLLATSEIYDLTTKHWTPAATLSQGVSWGQAVTMPDGSVLVVGGYTCDPLDGNCHSSDITGMYRYDGTWTDVGHLNLSRYVHAVAPLPGGAVLTAGGYHYDYRNNTYESAPTASAEIYAGRLAAPLITSPEPNQISFATSVTVAGTATAGATIKVFEGATPPADGSGAIGTVPVDASGNFGAQVDVRPGVHTLSFTQTAQGSTSDVATVAGVVVDLPPQVIVGQQPAISCVAPNSTRPVTLAANVTRDPLDPPSALRYDWTENGVSIGSGPSPSFNLAAGTHSIRLHVEDTYHAGADTSVVVALNGYSDPPIVTAPAPMIAECAPGSVVRTAPAIATDACDGTIDARPSLDSVPGDHVGHTQILYSATDKAGLTGTASSSIDVRDTTAPTFQAPPSQAFECAPGQSFPVAAVPAADLCDGSANAQPSQASINLGTPGRTSVQFTAVDRSGNAAAQSAEYAVQDTLAPQLTLIGPPRDVAECGGPGWRDSGARALDVCSGDLTARIHADGAVDIARVGTYVLNYTASDDAGNTARAQRSVDVRDTTPPSVTVVGAATQTLECGLSTYTEAGASALDMCSGDITSKVQTTGTVDTHAVASYSILYSAADTAGNASQASRLVSVTDTTPPKLVLAGSPRETLECGGTFLEPGATAKDMCVGDLSSSITYSGTVNGARVGTYDLSYSVADPYGNASSATRSVDVRDTTKPIVSLNGESSLRQECGTAFTDPGARASDVCAGDLTSSVHSSGAVDTQKVGTYVLAYSASDPSGNTGTASRSVDVRDTTPPSVTVNGAASQTLECGLSNYAEAGASANDTCGGNLTSSIVTSGAVNAGAVGSYSINYSATDASGNTSQAQRSVKVADTTRPELNIGASSATIECGGAAYTDAGAAARDACAGDLSSRITRSGAVDNAHVGTYQVRFDVADPSGNSSSATRSVSVRDTAAPSVTLLGSAAVRLECGTSFTDPGAKASDVCAGDLAASVTGSVDSRTVGRYVLNYTATDPSGNGSSNARTVSVEDAIAPTIALVGASDVTLECGGAGYVEQGATAVDQCVGSLTSSIVETGLPVSVAAVGASVLSYSVRDPSGNTASTTRRVVVRDTTPPTVALKPSFSMWPPNSSYQTFNLADVCIASIADQCGGPAATTARIDSIYSDEGLITNNDVVIQSNTSFMVRSARDGKGNGRVYGITFTVRDAAGNGRQSLCKIFVPHDQSATTTTDSGAAYTITNTF